MGYGSYDLEDGHGLRGYDVVAVCAAPGCLESIDKGLAYLCYSCKDYFCYEHLTFAGNDFECFTGENPQCCFPCAAEAEKGGEEE